MAALDFPDNPATGDLYGSSGTVWRWDGARWASTAGASGARGIVSYTKNNVAKLINVTTETGFTAATFTAVAGRRYNISIRVGSVLAVSGGTAYITARIGATEIARWAHSLNPGFISSAEFSGLADGGAGGTTTVTIYCSADGQTTFDNSTAYAGAGYILVEDITYEAGTSGVGIEPTAWVPVTAFLNGWVNYGAPIQPTQYRKVGDMVHLRGGIKSGASGSPAFYLPAGFRPSSPITMPLASVVSGSGAVVTGIISVAATDGGVYPVSTSVTDVEFYLQFSVTP